HAVILALLEGGDGRAVAEEVGARLDGLRERAPRARALARLCGELAQLLAQDGDALVVCVTELAEGVAEVVRSDLLEGEIVGLHRGALAAKELVELVDHLLGRHVTSSLTVLGRSKTEAGMRSRRRRTRT